MHSTTTSGLLSRTYSSPSLADKRHVTSPQYAASYAPADDPSLEEDFFIVGDRVFVDGFRPASVAFFGELEFAAGDWLGVVLDQPTGNHDGKVHGREYFHCSPRHGLFVRPHRARRMADSALGSSANSSRASTPLKRARSLRASPGASASASSGRNSSASLSADSPGYFYDEDYRSERAPTLASLSQKLRSMERGGGGGGARGQQLDALDLGAGSPRAGILKGGHLAGRHDRDNPPAGHRHRPGSADSSSVFEFRPRRAPMSAALAEPPPRAHGQDASGQQVLDLSSERPRLGDRVAVRSDGLHLTGTLRFLGETGFATGEWAGVELDERAGKSDGALLGERYFRCAPDHGLFVPVARVRKCHPEAASAASRSEQVFNSMRSTILSPPPTRLGAHGSASTSASGSRSTTPALDRASPSSWSTGTSASRPLDSPLSSSHSFRDDFSGSPSRLSDRAGSSTLAAPRTRPSYLDQHTEHDHYGYRAAKFDEADIEAQIRRNIQRPKPWRSLLDDTPTDSRLAHATPRSIKYTFISSKYDGNPIARRTVEY